NVPVKGVNPFDEWRMQDTFPKEENRSVEKYMFNSGNCAISKSVWEKFHFDERIPFAEDRLWAKAVLENGFKIKYLPAASAFHSHWFSQAQLFNRMRWQGFAVKAIYGNSCRYDGISWMSFAYVYFVSRDILYFVINGYFKFLPRIFVYRFIHLKGLYCGAKAYVRNEKI
ncbi:MAG: glycosyltransferase, partial [Candidatus Omnitrophota bacterium]